MENASEDDLKTFNHEWVYDIGDYKLSLTANHRNFETDALSSAPSSLRALSQK